VTTLALLRLLLEHNAGFAEKKLFKSFGTFVALPVQRTEPDRYLQPTAPKQLRAR
tara:strand:+ start:112 stop:276 length:165 start_codon:yes stop_codon:yes gene_type:complete